MIKIIALMKRAEHLTHDEFASWMLNDHAPLASQLPGLVKYRISISQSDDADYDSVNELYFASADARDAAFATDIGRRTAEDGGRNSSVRVHLLVDEYDQIT